MENSRYDEDSLTTTVCVCMCVCAHWVCICCSSLRTRSGCATLRSADGGSRTLPSSVRRQWGRGCEGPAEDDPAPHSWWCGQSRPPGTPQRSQVRAQEGCHRWRTRWRPGLACTFSRVSSSWQCACVHRRCSLLRRGLNQKETGSPVSVTLMKPPRSPAGQRYGWMVTLYWAHPLLSYELQHKKSNHSGPVGRTVMNQTPKCAQILL